jgi:protein disulfide isomerase family A protein 3
LENEDGGIVGYFDSDTDLKTAFTKAADKLRETFRFGIVSDPDVITAKGAESNTVVLHRPKRLANKFESSDVKYSGAADKSSVESWIRDEYHGLVGHRTTDNTNQFDKPLIVAYYGVDYVKNPKGTNYWRNRVLAVAKDFESLNFGVSAKDDFQHELNEFGIEYAAGDKPIVAAWNDKNEKFVMGGDFSVDKLRDWVKQLKDGLLEPFMKSEPIPEDNTKPLKVAVGKNFREVVVDNGVDTLIEFYAPWCGHCKKLAPVYEELAEKLKDEKVAIVKMDATANDVPAPFEVHGFPTIYWAPKNAKDKPVKYQGGRELSDFLDYISTHSTDGLSKSKDEL